MTVGDLFCGAGGFSTGFKQAGFDIKFGVDNWDKAILNAADYGLPQTRKRLFAGNFKIPRPTHSRHGGTTLDGRVLRSWIGWADALGLDLDDSVELVPNVGEKIHRTYKRNLGKKPGEPSQTLNTACTPRIYTAAGREKVRALTIEEAMIIQGLPKDYKLIGDRMKLVGNMVPPPLAKAIALAIREAHRGAVP